MLIGVTDYVKPPYDIESEAFEGKVNFHSFDSEDESLFNASALEEVDALLVWHARITEKTISNLKNCKIVVRYGVGVDNIDVAALDSMGIRFSNTPDYGVDEVADTALTMILNFHRGVPRYNHDSKQYFDTWQINVQTQLQRARNRTVGIIGLGRIGSAVALRLIAFGYRVIAFDPHLARGFEKSLGIERAWTLGELLSECDTVTLHCPLNKDTVGMVDSSFLSALRPGSFLINTARGGLCDGLDPLYEALKSNHLCGLGLDVLPKEPPEDHPLVIAWRNDEAWLKSRMIVTPHTAYYSEQAWIEMRHKAAETAAQFLYSGTHRNPVRVVDTFTAP